MSPIPYLHFQMIEQIWENARIRLAHDHQLGKVPSDGHDQGMLSEYAFSQANETLSGRA